MEEVMFAGRVPVTILKFRRDKHDFEKGWETEYLNALIDHLKEGMVVFDIGAEQGEFSAMAANIVGGKRMHLFEPSKEYWPNIYCLWKHNGLSMGGCFNGYVGEKSDDNVDALLAPFYFRDGDIYYDTHHSVPLHDENKTISIDDYCKAKGLFPDVVMIDCEGAELSIIRGSLNAIKFNSPTFFISIHNDEMIQQRSGGTKSDIMKFFENHEYDATHIHTDHEEHWKFERRKN